MRNPSRPIVGPTPRPRDARHHLCAFVVMLALAPLGCLGDKSPTDHVSGETHFLSPCDEMADCGSETACLCGVCTIPCTTDTTCSDVSATASCYGLSDETVQSCGTSLGAVCLAGCTSDADCDGGSLGCDDGHCLPSGDVVSEDTVDGDVTGPDAEPSETVDGEVTPTDAEPSDIGLDATDPDADLDGDVEPGDTNGGGGLGDGQACTTASECLGGSCTLGVCGQTCQAGFTTCPDGQVCVIPGDVAGVCVQACDSCGHNLDCVVGSCGPSSLASDSPLACIPPALGQLATCHDRCAQQCQNSGATCGSPAAGCQCGVCPAEQACWGGTCVAQNTCGGEPCTDGFGTAFCEGQSALVGCPDSTSGFRRCECTGAAITCEDSCGPAVIPFGKAEGETCTAPADCQGGQCSLGVCGPSCSFDGPGPDPEFGCPADYQCTIPGAAAGYCLRECGSDSDCGGAARCLAELADAEAVMVCRLP